MPLLGADLVPRPRLHDRVAGGADTQVTLVAAPAGFGKTALLASWQQRARDGAPVAWLSLAAGDNHPRRLADDLLAALPPAAAAAHGAPTGAPGELVALLTAALARLGGPLTLVLDDVHELTQRAVLLELAAVLRHPPAGLRVVLATRADPPLPLARLRVAGRLAEIRADELAFTAGETEAVLRHVGVALEKTVAGALWRRTEGWPAGVRLAAISLAGHPDPASFVERFAGDDRAVADYLRSEVLAELDSPTREFLLRTSIAERLTGGLADALTGRADGEATLARLERDDLFTTALDDRRTTFRYHELFAGLLRTELRHRLPTEVPRLHRRAAAWHAREGRSLAAIEHAVAGRAWPLAGELIVAHWFELLLEGRASDLCRLLDALPAEQLRGDPELALAGAAGRLELGDVAGAEACLAAARPEAVPAQRRAPFAATLAAVALQHASLTGAVETALDQAQRLLAGGQRASGHAGLRGGEIDRRALALRDLGSVELCCGLREQGEDHLRAALALARRGGRDYVAVGCLALLSVSEAARSRTTAAAALAREALGLAGPAGWTALPQLVWAHVALAFSHVTWGAADAAEAAAAAAIACAGRGGDPVAHLGARVAQAIVLAGARDRVALTRGLALVLEVRDGLDGATRAPLLGTDLEALELRLLLALGERELVRARLAGAGGRDERGRPAESAGAALVRTRLALVEGRPAAALACAAAALETAGCDRFARVDARVLAAVAEAAAHDLRSARDTLERALDDAEPEGCRWPFLVAGAPLRPLLEAQLRAGTRHRALVGELLAALHDGDEAARPRGGELLEPLSAREQAVLRYLPTELSNAEIAGELYVSVNTVKTHLRSIYRKLDVERRRDAIARARDLRLLSPGRYVR